MIKDTQPSAASVIGELMRLIDGRDEMFGHGQAQDWLLDNRYCARVSDHEFVLTHKGEFLAEAVIRKSGIIGMIKEDFDDA